MDAERACPAESVTRRRLAVIAGCAVSLVGLFVYALASGNRVYVQTGDSYPGLATAAAELLGYFLAGLSGAVTLGGLLFVVVTALPDDRGVIDRTTFRTHVLVECVAPVWVAAAVAMVVIQASSDSGAPLTRLLASGGIVDAVLASQMARAWIVVSLIAIGVATIVRLSLRWATHVMLLVPAAIGVVAVPVNGNAGQGPDHDYATSAAIVFACLLAVWVGVVIAAAINPAGKAATQRVLVIEVAAGFATLAYGAVLLGLLAGSDLVGSGYGRAGGVATILILGTWVGQLRTLKSHRPVRSRLIPAFWAVAMTVALALVATMATQVPPRFLVHQFTTWDVFLGYTLPDPPTVVRILEAWRFDVFIGCGAVALALAYLAGYFRLRRRGDHWSVGRLAAWLAGCVMLLFISSSGVKAYGSAMFSVHMAEHMTLNMGVPVLLVLGGPVTLALRALPAAQQGQPPGPREWVMWLVHSKVTAVLSHPIVAFVLFVASPYAVYFTPIFNTLVRYHWGHELMSVHFLLVGYLFFWGIIGIDPGPRK
ncbi:MAG: cytochrome c oxidase assembly protein, partial [Mycobacterium sp.]